MKLSRQRVWQKKQAALGRCIICGTKGGSLCAKHRARHREMARKRHRIKHGIPLDAPLWKRTKKDQ